MPRQDKYSLKEQKLKYSFDKQWQQKSTRESKRISAMQKRLFSKSSGFFYQEAQLNQHEIIRSPQQIHVEKIQHKDYPKGMLFA